jgi:hypothetical protein
MSNTIESGYCPDEQPLTIFASEEFGDVPCPVIQEVLREISGETAASEASWKKDWGRRQ